MGTLHQLHSAKGTILVKYKSRYTNLTATLINPSKEHVKKLFTTGHDLTIEKYNTFGTLVDKKEIKY